MSTISGPSSTLIQLSSQLARAWLSAVLHTTHLTNTQWHASSTGQHSGSAGHLQISGAGQELRVTFSRGRSFHSLDHLQVAVLIFEAFYGLLRRGNDDEVEASHGAGAQAKKVTSIAWSTLDRQTYSTDLRTNAVLLSHQTTNLPPIFQTFFALLQPQLPHTIYPEL